MEDLTREEQGNRKKGFIFSIVFHTMAVILLALYGFTFQNPPPEAGGILVNLGIPDVGQGDENAPISEPTPAVEEEEEEPEAEEEPEPEKKPEPVKETPKAEPKKEVVKTEDPEAIALKKKKEEEKKKADAEAKKKAEEERKRKDAEEKAEAKRKAEEAERKRKQDELAGAIGDALGKGKGNTGKPGNQGDPNGDPNSDILTGISTGSGVVGGGLGNRGVEKKGPAIKDNSQDQGTVYLDVCVDKNGNVISAEYTQKGSTTNSTRLKQLAIQNAKAWKFSKGSVDKQCGTIRYDFKLK